MSDDLKDLVKLAKEKFKTIKVDIPNIQGYLVWSSNLGQCHLIDDRLVIFSEFPQFFVQDENFKVSDKIYAKAKTLDRRLETERCEKFKNESKEIRGELLSALKLLIPRDDIFIEFRFETLDFELIRKLKTHSLVQQPPYMMSDAYIRVVLSKPF